MKKEYIIFIQHILDSLEKIERYSKNLTREKLEKDTKIQDAIVRRIEIIGEAIKNIPYNLKEKNPEIPWKEIVGTRDQIIHHYFGLDLDIIWNIIKNDLPDLKVKMQKIEKELKQI